MPELRGSHQEKLGETVRVRRVHDLRERCEFEEFAEERRGARANVADGQADVDIHVRIQVRQPSGAALIRIAVQEYERRTRVLCGGAERLQPGWIGANEVRIGVTEPGVQLDRAARVHRAPQQMTQQNRIGQPGTTGRPLAHPRTGRRPHLAFGRPLRRKVQAVAIGRDRLGRDGTPGERVDQGQRSWQSRTRKRRCYRQPTPRVTPAVPPAVRTRRRGRTSARR